MAEKNLAKLTVQIIAGYLIVLYDETESYLRQDTFNANHAPAHSDCIRLLIVCVACSTISFFFLSPQAT